MKHGYYLDKSKKLEKSLAAYLQKMKKPLLQRYGEKKADSIIEKSRKYTLRRQCMILLLSWAVE
jgi:hypothetical protein